MIISIFVTILSYLELSLNFSYLDPNPSYRAKTNVSKEAIFTHLNFVDFEFVYILWEMIYDHKNGSDYLKW